MAFRVVRLRREARRNAKLEEIFAVREREFKGIGVIFLFFQEKDKGQTGFIHVDTVSEIFRMYEVSQQLY